MKKLYAFAAIAIMATSAADAQLYLVGDGTIEGGATLAWDAANPAQINPEADGTYKFTINNCTKFKMSTAKGSWDSFNGAAIGVQGSIKVGENALSPWGEDNITAWPGDWTFIADLTANKLTASTTTPAPSGFTPIYLRGNWDPNYAALPDWQFSTDDGVIYTIECALDASAKFKVADANWGAINCGSVQNMEPNTVYKMTNAGSSQDCTLANAYTGKIQFNANTYEIILGQFATGIENIDVEESPAIYYNLQGARVENPHNGIFITVKAGKAVKEVIR